MKNVAPSPGLRMAFLCAVQLVFFTVEISNLILRLALACNLKVPDCALM